MSNERYCLDCYAANKGPIAATEFDDEDPLCLPCFNARTKRSDILATVEAETPRWTLDEIRDVYLRCHSVKGTAKELHTAEATLRKFVREHGVEDQWITWSQSDEDESETVTHQREQTVTQKESIVVKRKPKTPQPIHEVGGVERTSAITLQLKSGGSIRMELNAHLFGMSQEDRHFVFGIADRLRAYEDGDDKKQKSPYKTSEGDKVMMLPMSVKLLEQLFVDIADDDERAYAYAAWYRDDPAARPPKEGQ